MDSVSFITVTFDWQRVLDIKVRRKFRERCLLFVPENEKERWSSIMNCLVLPILPSLHAHSVPILLTFIYFIHPLVCFGMPRIATSSLMHAFRAVCSLPFHINPRTTPQFIGRSITGNGSCNELREGCLSRFGLSYFLYWCNQERCVLGLLMQTLRKLLKNRCP